MKITIYELLGMIKDDKAPKRIMYNDIVWDYIEIEGDYRSRHNAELFFNNEINNTWIMTHLNTKAEIIEPQEHKIPEKLDHLIGYDIQQFDNLKEYVEITTNDLFGKMNKVIDTLNEIIDYLEELK